MGGGDNCSRSVAGGPVKDSAVVATQSLIVRLRLPEAEGNYDSKRRVEEHLAEETRKKAKD